MSESRWDNPSHTNLRSAGRDWRFTTQVTIFYNSQYQLTSQASRGTRRHGLERERFNARRVHGGRKDMERICASEA